MTQHNTHSNTPDTSLRTLLRFGSSTDTMRLLAILFAAWSFFVPGLHAAEKQPPSLKVLRSVVGLSKSSEEFKKVLATYDFGKNPKRDNSWGSSFGVFFEISDDKVRVGMRPPSDATNMPVYRGELPRQLKSRDTVSAIVEKLGKSKKTKGDAKGYYEMTYSRMTVYTMSGVLYEVWLYDPD